MYIYIYILCTISAWHLKVRPWDNDRPAPCLDMAGRIPWEHHPLVKPMGKASNRIHHSEGYNSKKSYCIILF